MTISAPSQYSSIIDMAAAQYSVPASLLAAQEQVESGFNPQAVGPSGAEGIAQFLPSTAASLGIDPWDPRSAIPGQARYLRQLYDQLGGSWMKALEAYNAGSADLAAGAPYAQQVLNLAGPLSHEVAGSGPSSAAAASPGSCTPSGWQDAQCGALDIGCGVSNLWGGFSCALGNALKRVGYGLEIMAGLAVVGVGLAIVFDQTKIGQATRRAVRTAAESAALA